MRVIDYRSGWTGHLLIDDGDTSAAAAGQSPEPGIRHGQAAPSGKPLATALGSIFPHCPRRR